MTERLRRISGTAWKWFSSIAGAVAAIVTIVAFAFPGSTNSILDRILEAIREIPNAVSDDPIKELAQRGYSLTETNFYDASYAEDAESVKLFCKAGKTAWIKNRRLMFEVTYRSETYQELKSCKAFDKKHFCSIDMYPYSQYDEESEKLHRAQVYVDICGKNSLDEIAKRIEKNDQARHKRKVDVCNKYGDLIRENVNSNPVLFDASSLRHFKNVMKHTMGAPTPDWCAEAGVDLDQIWKQEQAKY